jgi:hypothetical protein
MPGIAREFIESAAADTELIDRSLWGCTASRDRQRRHVLVASGDQIAD